MALHDETALDGFTERDPAERSAFNRVFYRNRRPTWLGHWVSQFFCWWARLGLTPHAWVALHVRDRVSGRWRQDAVVLPSVAGERYVVSMFGTISDWVNNIEAAHGDAAISHGGTQRVRLVLVPPEKRAPILSEYVRVASSGRKHFPLSVGAPLADFAAIASHYPVYRIELPDAGGRRMQNPDRSSAMSGYLVIALGVAAAAFERGAPSANAPTAESIAFYSKYRSELLAQSILFVLSAGAYLWFFGSLRTWLERAEGGAGRVSAVAFGAGTVSVAMQMLLQTLQIAAVTGGASGSDAGGAVLFARVGWALSVVAYVPFAVLVAATAVVSLRHHALPTWIGRFSALVAGAHIVMFMGIAADSGPLVPGGALTYVLYGLALLWLIIVTTAIVVGGKSAVRMDEKRL